MEPRLKSSIKWTPFPEEFLTQIEEVFADFFEDYEMDGKSFRIQGAIYPEEVLLRVGLASANQLRQDNLEASLEINPKEDKALEKIHHLVDFLGQVWEDLLEDEKDPQELPRKWQSHQWEKQNIFFKYSTINTDLEEQADKLLEQYEKKLVYESEEEIDIDSEISSETSATH